jgi:hypothetical protein
MTDTVITAMIAAVPPTLLAFGALIDSRKKSRRSSRRIDGVEIEVEQCKRDRDQLREDCDELRTKLYFSSLAQQQLSADVGRLNHQLASKEDTECPKPKPTS